MCKVPGKQREAGRVLESLRRENQGEKWEVDERLRQNEESQREESKWWHLKNKVKWISEKNGREGGECDYELNLKISQGK